jgi:hypothetical protein
MSVQRLVTIPCLCLSLCLSMACSDDGGVDTPMFTSGDASQGTGDGSTMGESGEAEGGDGDPTTTGDGDGDPTTTGDGDGDGDPSGDGDGDPTTGGDGDVCDTDPAEVAASCGQDAGKKGAIAFGQAMTDLPIGEITAGDNGIGNGAEDWYQFEFPLDANNPRPAAGNITLDFAFNDGGDYRFELYRDCGAQAYGQGLAAEFGSNAPPLLEWTFGDLDDGLEQIDYLENVLWPSTVWVRVIRHQNANTCSSYQLRVMRN